MPTQNPLSPELFVKSAKNILTPNSQAQKYNIF